VNYGFLPREHLALMHPRVSRREWDAETHRRAADVLAFRAQLADKPGRTGAKLSNKRINNILGVLRQIMAEAADRYDFISPCANVKEIGRASCRERV